MQYGFTTENHVMIITANGSVFRYNARLDFGTDKFKEASVQSSPEGWRTLLSACLWVIVTTLPVIALAYTADHRRAYCLPRQPICFAGSPLWRGLSQKTENTTLTTNEGNSQ